MESKEIVVDEEPAPAGISVELKREIRLFRKLRPLIGYCLSLNHDINNPLSGILGFADFIRSDDHGLSVTQGDDLQQIVTCAERIKTLVGKVDIIKALLASDAEVQAFIAEYQQTVRTPD